MLGPNNIDFNKSPSHSKWFWKLIINELNKKDICCGKNSGDTILLSYYLLLSREKEPVCATDLRKMRTPIL